MHLPSLFRYNRQSLKTLVTFVPNHLPVSNWDVHRLKDFLIINKSNVVVLTGAGVSTESGIPDYRSEGVGLYARSNHKPMTYQEFTKNPLSRKRYWARSFVGWPRFSSVLPNSTHHTLSQLEADGFISYVITQNVDNLHQNAGTKRVIELHGTLHRVNCVSCSYTISRKLYQGFLEKLNPTMCRTSEEVLRPDGDVDLNENEIDSFIVPPCPNCGSYVKPDVIFFGDNLPTERNQLIKQIVNDCGSVLVLGSSLSVYSAYRIILQAAEFAKPVCIVNIGSTRADHLATIKINTKCGDILPATYNLLQSRRILLYVAQVFQKKNAESIRMHTFENSNCSLRI